MKRKKSRQNNLTTKDDAGKKNDKTNKRNLRK